MSFRWFYLVFVHPVPISLDLSQSRHTLLASRRNVPVGGPEKPSERPLAVLRRPSDRFASTHFYKTHVVSKGLHVQPLKRHADGAWSGVAPALLRAARP